MKKIFSIFICVTMMLGLINVVSAEPYIEFDETISGVISENNTKNEYSLEISEAGTIDITFVGENIEGVALKFFDENGQEIWSKTAWWNSTSKQLSFEQGVVLTAGVYTFSVSKYSGYGTYEFEFLFNSANESFGEEQNGSNNTFKTADDIAVNETYNGQIAVNDTVDNYSFTLDNAGNFDLLLTAENIESVYLKLYDENGQEIWSKNPWWNSTSEQISFKEKVSLTAGTYYFLVSRYSGYGNYEFEMSFETANESFPEEQNGSNNTFKTANKIEVDETYIGQLTVNDTIDNYVFTLENSGGFDLSFTAENIESVYLKIYDENGQEIWSKNPWWNSTSEQISFSEYLAFTSGTYYFSVSKYSKYGTYEFELLFEDANESFSETEKTNDNSLKTANAIEFDTEYTGQLAINDKTDNYVFEMSNSGEFKLSFISGHIECAYLKFYDKDGQVIRESSPWWNSTSKELSFTDTVVLERGTYYFSISKYSGYGPYSFSFNMDNDENYQEDEDSDDNSSYEDSEYADDYSETEIDFDTSGWAETEINDAHQNNLIPDEMYDLIFSNAISREEFAAVAVKLYERMGKELPAVNVNNMPFEDCKNSEYIEYIAMAYELGITKGTGGNKFLPNNNITREQLATMICRAFEAADAEAYSELEQEGFYAQLKKFNDDAAISLYAYKSIYLLSMRGVVNGVGNNSVAPQGTATREQAIIMALRVINKLL